MRQDVDRRENEDRIADALEGYIGELDPDDGEQYGIAALFVVQTDGIIAAINRLTAAVERLAPPAKNGEDSQP